MLGQGFGQKAHSDPKVQKGGPACCVQGTMSPGLAGDRGVGTGKL